MNYTSENPLKILSLGWGVQSWTLAAMSALGEIPKPDYAVHADTTHEAVHTYAHAEKWTPWLEDHGIRVVTVRSDAPEVHYGKGDVIIPAFSRIPKGSKNKDGQIRRECTNKWKIQPVRKFVRTLVPNPRPGIVEFWMGISLDEWTRMRDSDVKYIKNGYPLIDRRMNRADCVAWLQKHGLDVPGKSACVFCPYHNNQAWKDMKKRGGSDWNRAVAADNAIRRVGFHQLFVHSARKPLEEAVQSPEDHGASQLEMDMVCDSGVCFV
jgi:hypothetical protein